VTLNVGKIEALEIAPVEHRYDVRDTILYALGLGYGSDPVDPAQLQFVYEQGLKTVPSFSCVLAHPGFWLQQPEYGADWVKILHAEQAFEMHAPLPTNGAVRGEYSIAGLEDKGTEKGALMHQIKTIYDQSDNRKLATVRSTLFLRGDGGQGGFGARISPPAPLPDRAPDRVFDVGTTPQQALIYRLSGDLNPLHADPEIARKAGFPAPILHGLCTNGLACRALISAYCDDQPDRLASMFVRFSSPTMPGETIRMEFFEEADGLRFRARSLERDIVVLDRASATVI
jgi:acyl dehydratase